MGLTSLIVGLAVAAMLVTAYDSTEPFAFASTKPSPVVTVRLASTTSPKLTHHKLSAAQTTQLKLNHEFINAVRQGQPSAMVRLLRQGADINAFTPYHSEIETGVEQTALLIAISQNRTDLVQLLLNHGADPNARRYAPQSYTVAPLKAALLNDERDPNANIVAALVEAGARVNQPLEGGTPLALAATQGGAKWRAGGHHIRLMRLLLRHSARIEGRDSEGWTPLMRTFDDDLPYGGSNLDFTAAQFLLKHGANINVRDPGGRPALMHAIVYEPPFQSGEGENAAGRMAKFDLNVMQFLLAHGANVNARDKRGWTPLRLAVASMQSALYTGGGHTSPPGWVATAQQKERLAAVRLLAQSGANVNARDPQGWTPLLRALRLYQWDDKYIAELRARKLYTGEAKRTAAVTLALIQCLIQHGANTQVRAKDGTTALQLAVQRTAVRHLLLQARTRQPAKQPPYALAMRDAKDVKVLRLYNHRTGRTIWLRRVPTSASEAKYTVVEWSKDKRALLIDLRGGPLLVWREGHQPHFCQAPMDKDYTMGCVWSPDNRRVLVRVGISADCDVDAGSLYCLNAVNGKGYFVAGSVRYMAWGGQRTVFCRTVSTAGTVSQRIAWRSR